MRGTAHCVRCGVADPEDAGAPVARKPVRVLAKVPTVPLIVTIVGVLALAGLTGYTQLIKEQARKQRIWEALGIGATDVKVAEVESDAQFIGVSTDEMLRVRYYCLHRESQRPSIEAMRTVRRAASDAQRDPEAAVTEAAQAACKRQP